MTEAEARAAFGDILDQLDVKLGDRVMLGIDIGGVPLPAYQAPFTREGFRAREAQWCEFVLSTLTDRLGGDGTLLVPTFSYSCGKAGSTFELESTPSEVGPFTEYVRTRPGTCRSRHPIFSLAGTGRDARALLDDVGHSAFGARSPFERFAEHGVRFLCLGVELRNAITYVHHLEQCYGCPHRFHKAFDTRLIERGREVPGPWFAYVAFRGFDFRSDIASLQRTLEEQGALRNAQWEGRLNQLAEIDDVNRVGYTLLSADSNTFVNRALSFQFDETPAESSPRSVMLSITATEANRA